MKYAKYLMQNLKTVYIGTGICSMHMYMVHIYSTIFQLRDRVASFLWVLFFVRSASYLRDLSEPLAWSLDVVNEKRMRWERGVKVSRAVVYLLIANGISEGWIAEHSIVGCNDDVFDFTDELVMPWLLQTDTSSLDGGDTLYHLFRLLEDISPSGFSSCQNWANSPQYGAP